MFPFVIMSNNMWDIALIDSGATHSILTDATMFTDLRYGHFPINQLDSKTKCNAIGTGSVFLTLKNGHTLYLPKAYLFPNSSTNLLAQRDILAANRKVDGDSQYMRYINKSTGNVEVSPHTLDNGLLLLEIKAVRPNLGSPSANVTQPMDFATWHERLGHISPDKFKKLLRANGVRDITAHKINYDPRHNCESCALGKRRRAVHTAPEVEEVKATAPGVKLHTDISGPISPPFNYKGKIYRYFSVIVDDYSRYLSVKLLERKTDALVALLDVINLWEKQTGNPVKEIRFDNGELKSTVFDEYATSRGIKLSTTVPYSPYQNGLAEVYVRIVKNIARPMHLNSGLSSDAWGYSIMAVPNIKNTWNTSHNSRDTTAEELFTGMFSLLQHYLT